MIGADFATAQGRFGLPRRGRLRAHRQSRSARASTSIVPYLAYVLGIERSFPTAERDRAVRRTLRARAHRSRARAREPDQVLAQAHFLARAPPS
jgi:hypothetical protein